MKIPVLQFKVEFICLGFVLVVLVWAPTCFSSPLISLVAEGEQPWSFCSFSCLRVRMPMDQASLLKVPSRQMQGNDM